MKGVNAVAGKSNLRKGVGIKARRFIATFTLIIISFLCLFWFYILFVNATHSHSEILRGFSPLPGTKLADNWNSLINGSLMIWTGLKNSVIVAVLSAVLCTYFSTMTAYAIHAYEFKGREAMFRFILMVMMIPTQVTALGFIKMIGDIGFEDNLIPLIVPSIAAPVTFFYMKQYMESNLPLEIIEAARIDGSSEFRTFNTMVVPLMKPAIAVQAIFTFVSSWNNYFTPALLLHEPEVKTLPILIAQLRGADFLKFNMGEVYIMIAFSILPVIIVYMFLSRSIVQGLASGSVKG